ncbi:MAG: hypothetical protein ACREMB_23200 [Candidatus Rokuibacteriota bacterium]
MKNVVIPGLLAMSLLLALVGGATAAKTAPDHTKSDPGPMGVQMTRQSSPEGRKAMEEFMQSDRAPQMMANMMEMARRMGNGDPMLGMTRMMDMMGSMGGGGMMGGQSGMMQPDGARHGEVR